ADHVEGGGLAGAVRTDQRIDFTTPDVEADAGHGFDATETLGQTFDPQEHVVHVSDSAALRAAGDARIVRRSARTPLATGSGRPLAWPPCGERRNRFWSGS